MSPKTRRFPASPPVDLHGGPGLLLRRDLGSPSCGLRGRAAMRRGPPEGGTHGQIGPGARAKLARASGRSSRAAVPRRPPDEGSAVTSLFALSHRVVELCSAYVQGFLTFADPRLPAFVREAPVEGGRQVVRAPPSACRPRHPRIHPLGPHGPGLPPPASGLDRSGRAPAQGTPGGDQARPGGETVRRHLGNGIRKEPHLRDPDPPPHSDRRSGGGAAPPSLSP